MEVIFGNDSVSLCAGAVISCVYIVMISDFIFHAVRHGIRGMSIFRLLSFVGAVALVLSGLAFHKSIYCSMSLDIALSSMIILVSESAGARYQEEIPMAVLASVLFVLAVGISVMRIALPEEAGDGGPAHMTAVLSVSMILYCLVRAISDFSDIRRFLKGMTARKYAHAVVTGHFCILFLSLAFLGISATAFDGFVRQFLSLFCAAGMTVLHIGLYRRAGRDSVFILYDGYEPDFSGRMEQVLHPPEGKPGPDAGYRTTYERLNALFEDKKPYLDSDLTISDIARELYTNKLYVSKSINLCSGKNFCQYVNYHRVRYSMELFRADPRLKVSQLAEMSGFHTVASYNMAFKLLMHESPGEWCRRQRFMGGEQFEKSES